MILDLHKHIIAVLSRLHVFLIVFKGIVLLKRALSLLQRPKPFLEEYVAIKLFGTQVLSMRRMTEGFLDIRQVYVESAPALLLSGVGDADGGAGAVGAAGLGLHVFAGGDGGDSTFAQHASLSSNANSSSSNSNGSGGGSGSRVVDALPPSLQSAMLRLSGGFLSAPNVPNANAVSSTGGGGDELRNRRASNAGAPRQQAGHRGSVSAPHTSEGVGGASISPSSFYSCASGAASRAASRMSLLATAFPSSSGSRSSGPQAAKAPALALSMQTTRASSFDSAESISATCTLYRTGDDRNGDAVLVWLTMPWDPPHTASFACRLASAIGCHCATVRVGNLKGTMPIAAAAAEVADECVAALATIEHRRIILGACEVAGTVALHAMSSAAFRAAPPTALVLFDPFVGWRTVSNPNSSNSNASSNNNKQTMENGDAPNSHVNNENGIADVGAGDEVLASRADPALGIALDETTIGALVTQFAMDVDKGCGGRVRSWFPSWLGNPSHTTQRGAAIAGATEASPPRAPPMPKGASVLSPRPEPITALTQPGYAPPPQPYVLGGEGPDAVADAKDYSSSGGDGGDAEGAEEARAHAAAVRQRPLLACPILVCADASSIWAHQLRDYQQCLARAGIDIVLEEYVSSAASSLFGPAAFDLDGTMGYTDDDGLAAEVSTAQIREGLVSFMDDCECWLEQALSVARFACATSYAASSGSALAFGRGGASHGGHSSFYHSPVGGGAGGRASADVSVFGSATPMMATAGGLPSAREGGGPSSSSRLSPGLNPWGWGRAGAQALRDKRFRSMAMLHSASSRSETPLSSGMHIHGLLAHSASCDNLYLSAQQQQQQQQQNAGYSYGQVGLGIANAIRPLARHHHTAAAAAGKVGNGGSRDQLNNPNTSNAFTATNVSTNSPCHGARRSPSQQCATVGRTSSRREGRAAGLAAGPYEGSTDFLIGASPGATPVQRTPVLVGSGRPSTNSINSTPTAARRIASVVGLSSLATAAEGSASGAGLGPSLGVAPPPPRIALGAAMGSANPQHRASTSSLAEAQTSSLQAIVSTPVSTSSVTTPRRMLGARRRPSFVAESAHAHAVRERALLATVAESRWGDVSLPCYGLSARTDRDAAAGAVPPASRFAVQYAAGPEEDISSIVVGDPPPAQSLPHHLPQTTCAARNSNSHAQHFACNGAASGGCSTNYDEGMGDEDEPNALLMRSSDTVAGTGNSRSGAATAATSFTELCGSSSSGAAARADNSMQAARNSVLSASVSTSTPRGCRASPKPQLTAVGGAFATPNASALSPQPAFVSTSGSAPAGQQRVPTVRLLVGVDDATSGLNSSPTPTCSALRPPSATSPNVAEASALRRTASGLRRGGGLASGSAAGSLTSTPRPMVMRPVRTPRVSTTARPERDFSSELPLFSN